MESIKKNIVWIILVIVLIGAGIYIIIKGGNNNQGEKEYEALVDRICGVTLNLVKSHPEVIVIDKTKAGSIEYVTLVTLSGLTMDAEDKVSRYMLNPKESTEGKPKYFPETTRVKLRTDKNKKIVCDGFVDVGNSPTITLIGGDKITVAKGSTFKDPGVSATDVEDGNLTKKVMKNGLVNTAVEGNYTLLYFVEDSMGNITSKVRTVTVK